MSIMNQKDVRNNVHRSGFDLSRRVCFTAKVGELLPINWMPVLPGDKIDIDLNSFGRTAPLQTATFGRIREYYDVFFVPYRLLWKDFPEWIIQTKQAYRATNILSGYKLTDSHPYFTSGDMANYLSNLLQTYGKDASTQANALDDGSVFQYESTQKLLSYLGYGYLVNSSKPTDGLRLNPFPLATYQKIYQDYFRFSQWENTSPWTYNFDYQNVGDSGILKLPLSSLYAYESSKVLGKNMFTMQYCNFDRDMFNGVLPNAQYGDTSMVDVISTFPDGTSLFAGGQSTGITAGASSSTDLDSPYMTVAVSNSNSSKTQVGILDGTGRSRRMTVGNFQLSNFANKDILLNLQSQFSVLSLRKAEALQKWREITQSGDLDYQSQISKHWNESVPDTLSLKCQYVGGTARNIDVSEVINNNLADADTDANIAGKGILSANGHVRFDNKNNDYGILMVMYHAKPIIEWNASYVLPKELLKSTVDQYAIPEFDNLGNEKVMAYEMYPSSLNDIDSGIVAGYAPRYYEYKTSYDLVLGAFETTLIPWVLPFERQDFLGRGLNYTDFKVRPSIVDNLFGVAADGTVDTDQFYNTCYMDVKVVRNLSRDGLPY